MSNILQRYEVNPYETLFEQILVALGVDKDLEKCLKRLSKFKTKLLTSKFAVPTEVIYESATMVFEWIKPLYR